MTLNFDVFGFKIIMFEFFVGENKPEKQIEEKT